MGDYSSYGTYGALTGSEVLLVAKAGQSPAQVKQTTTGAIAALGGGGPITLGAPLLGMTMVGRTSYNRPAVSAGTLLNSQTGTPTGLGYVQDFLDAGNNPIGPIAISDSGTNDVTACVLWEHGLTGTFSIMGLCDQNWSNMDPSGGGHYPTSGIVFYETSSGKAILFGFNNGGGNPNRIGFYEINPDGTINSEVTNLPSTAAGTGLPLWFGMTWHGSDMWCFISRNALPNQWVYLPTASIAGWFTSFPDQYGIAHYGGSTGERSGMSAWQLMAETGAPFGTGI